MNYSHFVGIDVSKLTFDASILDSEEHESEHRRFRNDTACIQEMLDWTASFNIDINQTLFCAENMGCYVHLLSVTSQEKKFRLALASTLSIKRSMGLQRGKSDRIDARRIVAHFLVIWEIYHKIVRNLTQFLLLNVDQNLFCHNQ